MEVKKLKITEIKGNELNPRLITEEKFKKLVQSIKDFPEMLELRPIVVNSKMEVLGGNMRFKACVEAGLTIVPVIIANELTEEQENEFIIKDNVGFGQWDWDLLANNFDPTQLNEWALDVWEPPAEVDLSILDNVDLDSTIDTMEGNVKKAIQIEFTKEDYLIAQELVAKCRKNEIYIGRILIEAIEKLQL
jgi:hypothetical protein